MRAARSQRARDRPRIAGRRGNPGYRRSVAPFLLFPVVAIAGSSPKSPADRLPTPKAEKCKSFDPNLASGGDEPEFAAPEGLAYEEVAGALKKVLPTALYCPRPPGVQGLRMAFELVIGCNGVVSHIEASRTDGAPEEYIACVAAVIAKADFPAHDLPDGMEVTYPVNVSW